MNDKLEQYKELLEEDICLLGYEQLRYSLFAGENVNREEYQVRIEYVIGKYEVYVTADRASIIGKYEYNDIFEAFDMFLSIMQGRILTNRRKVKNGEIPEYPSILWDKN